MKKFLICLSLALVCAFSVLAVSFSSLTIPVAAADDTTVRYELSYQYKEGPTSIENAMTDDLTVATKFAGNTVHDVGEEITIDFTPQPFYLKDGSNILSEYTFLRFDYQLHEDGAVLSLRPGEKISFSEDDVKDLLAYDNGVKMLTLVAVYSERVLGKVHRVTFLATPKFETFYVQDGQKLNYIEQAMEGYDFDGWYTDEAFTSKYDFDNYTVTSDLKLYPKFTKQAEQEKTEIESQVDGLFNAAGIKGLEFGVQIVILVGLVIVIISIFK